MSNIDTFKLYNGDCIEIMKQLPDKSIDFILCDPPYGTTPLQWDKVISFEDMWKEYNRIAKDNCTIILFGQEPFSSFARISNIKNYKYDWVWEKERLTNVFQVKRRPGKTVENIMVFFKKQGIYNSQKTIFTGKPVSNKIGKNAKWSVTQDGGVGKTKPYEYHDDGTRHPTQVLKFNRDDQHHRYHATQKPVKLLEYLIKTYTNEEMIVLDNCMGVGSTGVACRNTNRQFIGIEKEKEYYDLAIKRIKESDENGHL